MADNSGNNPSGTKGWRQRVGIKGSMPKISDEFRSSPPPPPRAEPSPVPPRTPAGASSGQQRAVSSPAPMAPRRPVKPAPSAPPRPHNAAPTATDIPAARPGNGPATNAFGERLRAQREAAELLAKKRAEETRDRLAGNTPADKEGPKFTFADSELKDNGQDTSAHASAAAPPPPPAQPRADAQTAPPRSTFRPQHSGIAPQPYQPSEAYRQSHDFGAPNSAPEGVERQVPPPMPPRAPVENRYAPPESPQQGGYTPPQGGAYDGAYARSDSAYRPPVGDERFEDRRPPQPAPRAPLDRADANDYSAAYRDYDEAFDYEDEPSGRGGLWIFVLLMLLVVAAIAAGAYWFINYGSTIGSPTSGKTGVPTITAPEDPVKVTPKPADTTTPSSPVKRKKIYDRILGDQTLEPEKLVPTEEKPKTAAPAVAPVPKVEPPVGVEPLPLPLPPPPTVPGTQGSVSPTRAKVAAAPPGQGNSTTLGQTTVSPTSGGTTTAAEKKGGQVLPLPLPKVETVPTVQPNTTSTSLTPATPATPAPATVPTNTQTAAAPVPPLPRSKPTSVIARAKQVAEQQRLASLTRAVTPTPSVPTAPLTGSGPRQITPGTGGASNFNTAQRAPTPPTNIASLPQPTPTTPQPQTGATGGYVLQMSSFRDRNGAATEYRRLLSKHPTVLRGLNPQIQEANLGASGKAYKLRLGSIASRAQAEKMCYALIAAGEKDCLVRNR